MGDPIITCVLLARLQLAVAAGSRTELFGVPAAVAPEPGSQQIGEVSVAAEAFGVHAGMRLGEALARCPRLTLVPPDPAGVADHWEGLLLALEAMGAAVEPMRPGVVCFDMRGLLRLHGGSPTAVLAATRQALGMPARLGVAPTRFTALAAATRARVRHPVIITGGAREAKEFLAGMPVALLRGSPELAALPEAMERLGIRTVGELAALPLASVADRFGRPGQQAHRLARGIDTPLVPRSPGELVEESLELPEAAGGIQLEHALGLLIDRLLARRERRGRTLRAVVLSAVLVEQGGTWRQQATFREPLSDPIRMRLALTQHLAKLPAPAQTLRIVVQRFGPPTNDQRALLGDAAAVRAGRLREAVRQARAAAGPDAALRILAIDPDSRFPERRSVLAPFER